MGEVYKATDTRLDRTVAIKVLPEHVAADPDLKQRFEREARTVAALNHPHICTLHDIGSQDGIDFLVMEYLDGPRPPGWLRPDEGYQPIHFSYRTGVTPTEMKTGLYAWATSRAVPHSSHPPQPIAYSTSAGQPNRVGCARSVEIGPTNLWFVPRTLWHRSAF